jgi:hypothetical protein
MLGFGNITVIGMFGRFKSLSKFSNLRYKCATCDKVHKGLPDLGFDAPIYWHGERESEDSVLNTDLCVLEGRDFFLRALLEIPIRESRERLGWGVWSSVSRENFNLYVSSKQSSGPFFGWFSNSPPGYEETLNLKCSLQQQKSGLRPLIDLEPTEHQLSIDQREGITVERALALIELSGIRILSV